jgi:hypothetical protein
LYVFKQLLVQKADLRFRGVFEKTGWKQIVLHEYVIPLPSSKGDEEEVSRVNVVLRKNRKPF